MNTSAQDQNKERIHQLYEGCFNRGDDGLLEQLVGPDFVGVQGDKGPAAFRKVIVMLRTAFPDIHYTLDDVVAEGEKVAVRWHWTGTNQAPFRGHPPTHKAVTSGGAAIFRLQGGKVVAADIETDRLGFLQQIGLVPPDAVLLSPAPRPQ